MRKHLGVWLRLRIRIRVGQLVRAVTRADPSRVLGMTVFAFIFATASLGRTDDVDGAMEVMSLTVAFLGALYCSAVSS
jgi:hypothetical protein